MAIGSLIPDRSERPRDDTISLDAYIGEDPMGSVDDLILGRKHCWWRQC